MTNEIVPQTSDMPCVASTVFAELLRHPRDVRGPNRVGGIKRPEALGLEAPVRPASLAHSNHRPRRFGGHLPAALAAGAPTDLSEIRFHALPHVKSMIRLLLQRKKNVPNRPPPSRSFGSSFASAGDRTQGAGREPN